MEKRLPSACSLAIQNFANSDFNREQRNSRCSLGMFLQTFTLFIYKAEVCIYVSAWASGVARSVGVGNAKALYSGTSNEVQTLTLFSYLCLPKTIINRTFCRGGAKHL